MIIHITTIFISCVRKYYKLPSYIFDVEVGFDKILTIFLIVYTACRNLSLYHKILFLTKNSTIIIKMHKFLKADICSLL